MELSKVSVIIPAFNYAHYLEECVGSVLAQTYQNFEIIIADDGSTDSTPQVAERLVRIAPSRIRYLRGENRGVSETRNEAIRQSSGEFILPLDADDALVPSALEEFVKALRGNPQAGYAYSNLENYQSLPGEPRVWHQGPFFKRLFTVENNAASASMWRRILFDKGVRYRKVIFEDWDLWQQIVARGFQGAYIPRILFRYRMHLSGRTGKNRYFYFPALLQEMRGNPELYEPHLVEWAKNCLVHDPECWNKPTVVLLPRPGSPGLNETGGVWEKLAEHFSSRGHFVAELSEISGTGARPGIARISLQPYHIGSICHRIGSFGSNLLIISALSEWYNGRIELLKNVGSLIALRLTGESDNDMTLPSFVEYKRGEELTPFGDRFYYSRGPLDLISSPKLIDFSEIADELITAAVSRARAKKQEEDAHWLSLHESINSAAKPSLLTQQLPSVAIIAPVSKKEAPLLARALSVRRNIGQKIHVVLHASSGTPYSELLEYCATSDVSMEGFPSRAPYSYSRLANYAAKSSSAEWLLFMRSDTLLSQDLLRVFSLYASAFKDKGVFPFEAAHASPGDETGASAQLRPHIHCDGILVSRRWYEQLGGFSEEFLGEGTEFDDLIWRSEALGGRTTWLPPGLVVRVFSLERRTQGEVDAQRSVWEVHKSSFPAYLIQEKWGVLSEAERSDFSHGDEVASPFIKALEPLPSLEKELLRKELGTADRIKGLFAWGQHCIREKERQSARRAFQDMLLIDPENADAYAGLAVCEMAEGNRALAGHYAYAALAINENHSLAIEAKRVLEQGER